MIRPEVQRFAALGRLPAEFPVTDEQDALYAEFEAAYRAITRPVTDEEAEALADCFGVDLAYGFASSLLALIETAPHAGERRPAGVLRWRAGLGGR